MQDVCFICRRAQNAAASYKRVAPCVITAFVSACAARSVWLSAAARWQVSWG